MLHQTGINVNDKIVEIDDDPLFNVGEESVLFLHQYEPGKFFVLSGPFGRFTVEKGVVRAASKTYIDKFSSPANLADFLAQVKGA